LKTAFRLSKSALRKWSSKPDCREPEEGQARHDISKAVDKEDEASGRHVKPCINVGGNKGIFQNTKILRLDSKRIKIAQNLSSTMTKELGAGRGSTGNVEWTQTNRILLFQSSKLTKEPTSRRSSRFAVDLPS
jgi:hypothetical protein